MRIAAVTMIRDERDILPSFLGYNQQFIDVFFIADHGSIDGSSELLAASASLEHPGALDVRLFRFVCRQYFQREVCRGLADRAFADGADWVLFLDADEFLLFDDRAALETRLEQATGGVAAFDWLNLIPTEMTTGSTFVLGQQFRRPPLIRTSPIRKIALSRAFMRQFPFYRLKEGNHGVELAPDHRTSTGEHVGRLAHVPVRSAPQARHKVRMTLESTKEQGRTITHLRRLSALLEAEVDASIMIETAVQIYEGGEHDLIEHTDTEPRAMFSALNAQNVGVVPGVHEVAEFTRQAPSRDGAPGHEEDIELPYGRIRIVASRSDERTLRAERRRFTSAAHAFQRFATRCDPRRAVRLVRRRRALHP